MPKNGDVVFKMKNFGKWFPGARKNLTILSGEEDGWFLTHSGNVIFYFFCKSLSSAGYYLQTVFFTVQPRNVPQKCFREPSYTSCMCIAFMHTHINLHVCMDV